MSQSHCWDGKSKVPKYNEERRMVHYIARQAVAVVQEGVILLLLWFFSAFHPRRE